MNKKNIIFNFLLRKCQENCISSIFWKPLFSLYTNYLGCDIKYNTKIGKDFAIYHGARGSVISPTSIIGNNVSLRQCTTIGAKGFGGSELSPVIEDNVTIGPNVCIIGNIRVGKNAVIGAGAVVVKDVPPYSIVAGNPARILRKLNNSGGVNKHKCILSSLVILTIKNREAA